MKDYEEMAAEMSEDLSLLGERLAQVESERDRLRDEVSRRDVVLDWLRENTPRALELCPYKLSGPQGGSDAR